MLHQGKIQLDIQGEEKKKMTVAEIVAQFGTNPQRRNAAFGLEGSKVQGSPFRVTDCKRLTAGTFSTSEL